MNTEDKKLMQTALKASGYYSGKIDGIFGFKTYEAANKLLDRNSGVTNSNVLRWNEDRKVVGAVQVILLRAGYEPGVIDGYFGPTTDYALDNWSYYYHNKENKPTWRNDYENDGQNEFEVGEKAWGLQRDMDSRYGPAGGRQCYAGVVKLPFTMYLAWNTETSINSFRCHEQVASSAQIALENVADIYSQDEIIEYGLNLFGGCYNYRKMRGGNTLSTHAYGLAIDFDPLKNRLRWDHTQANFAKDEFDNFWKCWLAEGWTSLGLKRDYDWMHVQAVGI